MRFLLRPSWLALVVAVVGFAIACYTLLAPWQFSREAERRAEEAAIAAAEANPPVPFAELVPPGAGVETGDEWRRVQLTGTYLPDLEAVVRLRSVDGTPAFEVLTPIRADDGRLVTVNRGYVPSADGRRVPEYAAAPTGSVTIVGRLRPDEVDPRSRPPIVEDGHRQVYAAGSGALAAATGLELVPGVVQLVDGQPGVLTALPAEPRTSAAPFSNLSYALQWLIFGAIALVALGLFIRLELLQRRRAASGGDDPDRPGESPLAERYGRR